LPPTTRSVPGESEWHMKCMSCMKVVVETSFLNTFLTDLLPKGLYSKRRNPQYTNMASMTTCPTCKHEATMDTSSYGHPTGVTNGFTYDESCLALTTFRTKSGEDVHWVKSGTKVLYYDSAAAMALVAPKDPTSTTRIYSLPDSNMH
jgi:hypothetical protein